MKKGIIILCAVVAVMFSSCKMAIVPKAVNTVNSVTLSELNLERKDYVVLNTITAEASITYMQSGKRVNISDNNGEFNIVYKKKRKGMFGPAIWEFKSFNGIARFGFLSNDYEGKMQNITDDNDMKPEYLARNLAIYRLINACKVAGGDGVIEPIISTNVSQSGRNSIVFHTTVSAKVIKIKPDGK